MKKVLSIIVCFCALCACNLNADNDKVIPVTKLPAAAQQFINRHFAGEEVALAKVDNDITHKSYEVYFTNGSSVDFDGKGNWKEVDCKAGSVPESVVPAEILRYVRENYPGAQVVKIERGRRDYEVKLSNRIELTFDMKFNLLEIDV